MRQFRKQLEADRERRLAGGRNRDPKLGVKRGKVDKKDKKDKKSKDKAGMGRDIITS